ncbi:hypothetical protein BJF84_20165 [Rhodococcus sp. CUA-806]|nr:hypothetical protein BJF84_20165 [Rhodococcus sp. CUA-806]
MEVLKRLAYRNKRTVDRAVIVCILAVRVPGRDYVTELVSSLRTNQYAVDGPHFARKRTAVRVFVEPESRNLKCLIRFT